MDDRSPGVRLILAGLAVLASAAASLAAGTTATGLLVRVAVGGLGFYVLGAGIDKALVWASLDRGPRSPTAGSGGRGSRVNVLLAPVAPDGRERRPKTEGD